MSAAAPRRPDRYHLLDGLRGVAAVLVVFYHLGQRTETPWLVPGGYLAVDFFFPLSGVVIANAYEARLRAGWPFARFLLARVVRLYPLYLLGLALGLAAAADGLLQATAGREAWPVAAMANLLMLPSPGSDFLFPYNLPAWSLFFELLVNAGYARWCACRSAGMLTLPVTAAAVALLILAAFSHGLDRGAGWSTLGGGLARATFSFGLGVLLWRSGFTQSRATMSRLWWVPCLVLPLLLIIEVVPPWRNALDAGAMLIVFPLLIVVAAGATPPRWLLKPCAWLGDVSYPLYAIHLPLLVVVLAWSAGQPLAVRLASAMLASLGAAALAVPGDARVRGWLAKRFRSRMSAPPQLAG